MFSFDFYLMIFLGILVCISMVWSSLTNLERMLMKYYPKNGSAGENRAVYLMKNESYVHHKKRWGKIYISMIPVYVISYILIAITMDNLLIAFLGGLTVLFVCYGIMSNKELVDRKKLIKEIEQNVLC